MVTNGKGAKGFSNNSRKSRKRVPQGDGQCSPFNLMHSVEVRGLYTGK